MLCRECCGWPNVSFSKLDSTFLFNTTLHRSIGTEWGSKTIDQICVVNSTFNSDNTIGLFNKA